MLLEENPQSVSGGFETIDDIRKRIDSNEKVLESDENDITSQLEKQRKKNSIVIDLRLGSEVFLSTNKVPIKLNKDNEYVNIEPGEFALLMTYERVNMPKDLLAFISMRFTYSLKGLINISGFHVDPGYEGKIIFSVYNAGPNRIVLKYKEEIFMIIFAKIGKTVEKPEGKKFQKLEHISSDHITGLVGLPVSVQSLEQRIQKLETWRTVLGWVIVGLVAAVITMRFSLPGG